MDFYGCCPEADKKIFSKTFEPRDLLILQDAEVNLCVTTYVNNFLSLEFLHELL